MLFTTPGDLPDPGVKSESLESPALAGGFFTTNTTWDIPQSVYKYKLGNIGAKKDPNQDRIQHPRSMTTV